MKLLKVKRSRIKGEAEHLIYNYEPSNIKKGNEKISLSHPDGPNGKPTILRTVSFIIAVAPFLDIYIIGFLPPKSIAKKEISKIVDELYNDLDYKFEHTKHKSSGWVLKQIIKFFVNIHDVKPIRGSSYIPTPDKYKNPKCGLVNIQNNDVECFKWCMKYHQTKNQKNILMIYQLFIYY